MFCVGDCVTDHVLKKNLEHAAGFFVDQATDALDTATAGETPNSRLRDALDVITQDLAMALGATLA